MHCQTKSKQDDLTTVLTIGNQFIFEEGLHQKTRGVSVRTIYRGRRWRRPPGDRFPALPRLSSTDSQPYTAAQWGMLRGDLRDILPDNTSKGAVRPNPRLGCHLPDMPQSVGNVLSSPVSTTVDRTGLWSRNASQGQVVQIRQVKRTPGPITYVVAVTLDMGQISWSPHRCPG